MSDSLYNAAHLKSGDKIKTASVYGYIYLQRSFLILRWVGIEKYMHVHSLINRWSRRVSALQRGTVLCFIEN